jgi:hypothetical protein
MNGYCPLCDPLLACGVVRCGRCGVPAWPADAEWLPDGQVVATYPGACAHHDDDMCAVVDPAWLTTDPRWCVGRTATGAFCRNRRSPGSAWCHWHNPARQTTP